MSNIPCHSADASVSVIIPAHNEERSLRRCIDSVRAAGHDLTPLDIVVVDHQSTDATAQVGRMAGARVVGQPRGKRIGAVRNAGLAAATGAIVAFVDADCTVPDTWLTTALSLLRTDATIGAVGGPCLAPADGTWVERCLAPSRVAPGVARPAIALATSSLIAPACLLAELGRFDETLISGEDDDLSNRIRRRGLGLVLSSDCHIVHHGYPKTLPELLRKEMWHGSNHIEVRSRLDPTLILTFVFLTATLVAPLALVAALLRPGTPAGVLLAGVLALQFSAPFLFAAKRLRQSSRDLPLAAPLVLVGYTYFLGHGIGVLANLIRRIRVTRLSPGNAGNPDP